MIENEGALAPEAVAVRRGVRRPAVEGRGTLSHQLRELIRGRPESPHALAIEAGIDPTALGRFLTGKRSLTMTSADRLAVALGLRLGEGFARAKPGREKKPAGRKVATAK